MDNNKDIRKMARRAGIPMWKIAVEMGVSENSLFRWLRRELPEERRAKIIEIIKKYEQEDE